MVSYTSVVLAFLLLVGPVMVLQGLAPEAMTPWTAATLLSAGLFLIWMSIQMHDAFTQFRFQESLKETENIAFLREERPAAPANAVQVAVRKAEKVTESRPRPAAIAQGSPIS